MLRLNMIELRANGHGVRSFEELVEQLGLDAVASPKRSTVPLLDRSDQDGEKRYSVKVETVTGPPDPRHISTSCVERQNLTMRTSMRRFTRLTNAFSKKVENHAAAIALYSMYYNFGRMHQTLRVTPAVEAGVDNHVWSVEAIVGLLA